MAESMIPSPIPENVFSVSTIRSIALSPAEIFPVLLSTKPIPRWDVHFGEIDDDRKDSTAPHITFRPQLDGHR